MVTDESDGHKSTSCTSEEEPKPSTSKGKTSSGLDIAEIRRMLLQVEDFKREVLQDRRSKKIKIETSSEDDTSSGKTKNLDVIKSPSETTVYIQALKKRSSTPVREGDEPRYRSDEDSDTENSETDLSLQSFSLSETDDEEYRWRERHRRRRRKRDKERHSSQRRLPTPPGYQEQGGQHSHSRSCSHRPRDDHHGHGRQADS